jgi:isoprenylcysteine carboxyl methyltransferase (ICMT) family protein YpbQ
MSGKEILLGSGIVVVAALLFFFLSRWFTDNLVGKRKSHSTASRAGWSLFFFLTFTVCLLVFGALGHMWTTWLYIVPMALLILVSLTLFLLSAFSSK